MVTQKNKFKKISYEAQISSRNLNSFSELENTGEKVIVEEDGKKEN